MTAHDELRDDVAEEDLAPPPKVYRLKHAHQCPNCGATCASCAVFEPVPEDADEVPT